MADTFTFGGATYTSPTVASTVNDTAMLPQSPPASDRLVLVGACTDGAPNKPLEFFSPTALQAALGSGDLVDAGIRAFKPSPDVGAPRSVTVIRVNPALAASAALKDGSGTTIATLTSASYGAIANLTSFSVAAGSTQGFRLTAKKGVVSYSQDNVYQGAFSLQYAGAAATATVTIAGTSLTLNLAGASAQVISLTQFATVQALVDLLNTVPGLTATTAPGAANLPTLNGLDYTTTQDIKAAAFTVTATLQAVINWFNSQSQFITAARAANVGTLPAATPATYLTGGSDGTITNTNWASALAAAQLIDIQWIVALTSDPTIHAMVSSHVAFMSGQGRSERRGFASGPIGMTDAQAIAAAAALGSDRMAQVHLGVYDYDLTGVQSGLVLYAPCIHAAMVAAGFAGAGAGVAMTNNGLNVQGMERVLRNPVDTDPLIQGGVLCTAPDGAAFKVVRSVSTWLVNNKFNRVEISCGSALDYTCRAVRAAVKPFLGKGNGPALLGLQLTAADTALKQCAKAKPIGAGVLVGDANSPAYTGLTASAQGDDTLISFQGSPVIPNNFIGISVSAVPYSGTASA